ncbi:MAG: GIY-YIG nuclease family protein [Candidatus Moraniibacteriota bacterium]
MHYVYVLRLDKVGGKEFYIGSTVDLRNRLEEHNKGYTKTTKGRNPKLV